MTTDFQSYLERARSEVRELSVEALEGRLASPSPPLLIDVREADETLNGVIPGATLIPRGLLELRVEAAIPDRRTPIVLYCAAGTRSVLAAVTLQALGYTDVASLAGGFARHAQLGRPVEHRRRLTADQEARYARHITLPEVGYEGQLKLMDAKVLCVGAGGLGSPTALYLAAAGVGTIGIVDADKVDRTNLQRQILHAEDRVGMPKVDSAAKTLRGLNGDVTVNGHAVRLTSQNALDIISRYDLVIDGSDNFPTRYLINDACVLLGKPNVHGSIYRFEGQATVFHPGHGPCYRCLFSEPPPPELSPNCQDAGVFGVLPGIIGVIQAIEAVKLILGKGDSLSGRLLTFDALAMTFGELGVPRDPECPMCGDAPTIRELIDYEQFCSHDGRVSIPSH
ncbi:MAG: molybdopterin-synthase adenylyltransferase MoeB [Myxococcales bacterium]|nr:molybdopterin-synthase adenylyltransferase MoeB [Myxococcales bacterium]